MSGFSSQSVASADYKYKQEISLLLLNTGMWLKSYRLWSDFAFSIYFPLLQICKCSVKNSLLGGKGHIIKTKTWKRELGIKKQLYQQWDGITLVLFKVSGYLFDKRSCYHLIKSQEKSPAVFRRKSLAGWNSTHRQSSDACRERNTPISAPKIPMTTGKLTLQGTDLLGQSVFKNAGGCPV